MSKTSISIHGSCLTRDIFSYIDDDNIIINNYTARQSILSSISTSLNCTLDEINLPSKFQNDMILCDLNKLLFTRLSNNKSDFFIIDCIDERFNLFSVNDSIFTLSNEIKASKILNTLDYKMIKKLELEDNLIKQSVSKYVDKILSIYKEEEIIIHEVYYSNKYIDKNGDIIYFNNQILKSNNLYNNLLSKFYLQLKLLIPNAFVINKTNNFLASENNKWGLSPFHYEDKYYKDIYNDLCNIIFK